MATSQSEPGEDDDLFDDFLESRGHEVGTREWDEDHNKKQCPDCGGIHDDDATECGSCGWEPEHRR
jgi:hypothetical protein